MTYKLCLINYINNERQNDWKAWTSQWESLAIRLESPCFPWNTFPHVSVNYQVEEYTRALLLFYLVLFLAKWRGLELVVFKMKSVKFYFCLVKGYYMHMNMSVPRSAGFWLSIHKNSVRTVLLLNSCRGLMRMRCSFMLVGSDWQSDAALTPLTPQCFPKVPCKGWAQGTGCTRMAVHHCL